MARKLETVSTTVLDVLFMYMRNAGRSMWLHIVDADLVILSLLIWLLDGILLKL